MLKTTARSTGEGLANFQEISRKCLQKEIEFQLLAECGQRLIRVADVHYKKFAMRGDNIPAYTVVKRSWTALYNCATQIYIVINCNCNKCSAI